jgi:hypothetical protein
VLEKSDRALSRANRPSSQLRSFCLVMHFTDGYCFLQTEKANTQKNFYSRSRVNESRSGWAMISKTVSIVLGTLLLQCGMGAQTLPQSPTHPAASKRAKCFFTVPPSGNATVHRPAGFSAPIRPGIKAEPRLPNGRSVRLAVVGICRAGTGFSRVDAASTRL